MAPLRTLFDWVFGQPDASACFVALLLADSSCPRHEGILRPLSAPSARVSAPVAAAPNAGAGKKPDWGFSPLLLSSRAANGSVKVTNTEITGTIARGVPSLKVALAVEEGRTFCYSFYFYLIVDTAVLIPSFNRWV